MTPTVLPLEAELLPTGCEPSTHGTKRTFDPCGASSSAVQVGAPILHVSSPEDGLARIARLVGANLSSSLGAGVVVYERMTIDWKLGFDEVVVVLEGAMLVRSGDKVYECRPGDIAWFPANQA
jgi:ethanolamine utilization protein EutQ (cupin superfamily)